MTKDEELQDAYNKLDAAEMQATRMRKHISEQDKTFQLLIVAGFVTQEKVNEARDLLYMTDKE